MKIAFWSETKESGTTCNMSVIACMAAMKYSFRTALISGGFHDLDLELSFQGGRELAVAELGYYSKVNDHGFDQLIQDETGVTAEQLKKNMSCIIENKLFCLPAGKKRQAVYYPESLAPLMGQIVSVAEQCYDLVFIDCGCRKDLFTRKILREADITVINMQQNSESFSQFFRKHYDIRGRVFFLIGNYFADDVYTKDSLEHIFRMGEENIGSIPYNIHLARAYLSGRTEQYLKRSLEGELSDRQTLFFKEADAATFQILKQKIQYNH